MGLSTPVPIGRCPSVPIRNARARSIGSTTRRDSIGRRRALHVRLVLPLGSGWGSSLAISSTYGHWRTARVTSVFWIWDGTGTTGDAAPRAPVRLPAALQLQVCGRARLDSRRTACAGPRPWNWMYARARTKRGCRRATSSSRARCAGCQRRVSDQLGSTNISGMPATCGLPSPSSTVVVVWGRGRNCAYRPIWLASSVRNLQRSNECMGQSIGRAVEASR
jgi:hypothetical protein